MELKEVKVLMYQHFKQYKMEEKEISRIAEQHGITCDKCLYWSEMPDDPTYHCKRCDYHFGEYKPVDGEETGLKEIKAIMFTHYEKSQNEYEEIEHVAKMHGICCDNCRYQHEFPENHCDLCNFYFQQFDYKE